MWIEHGQLASWVLGMWIEHGQLVSWVADAPPDAERCAACERGDRDTHYQHVMAGKTRADAVPDAERLRAALAPLYEQYGWIGNGDGRRLLDAVASALAAPTEEER